MCAINEKYFKVEKKCPNLVNNKENKPFCAYFDTDKGNSVCRRTGLSCICVSKLK